MKLSQTAPTPAAWEHHLLIDLGEPRRALSSAVLGGGFGRLRYIVNRSVDKAWHCTDPVADMKQYVAELGLEPSLTIGLITAVSQSDVVTVEMTCQDWSIQTFVTVGVSNAAKAGGRYPLDLMLPTAGTINLILVVAGLLSDAALVAGVQTASEAKVAALQDAAVRTRFNEIATGTTTDTVTIVCNAAAPTSLYAGTATVPGHLIASTVYCGVSQALKERNGE